MNWNREDTGIKKKATHRTERQGTKRFIPMLFSFISVPFRFIPVHSDVFPVYPGV